MSLIQAAINFKVFDEFQFWHYAEFNRAYITEDNLRYKPITGRYDSSEVIDLLDGFTNLKHIVVFAHSNMGRQDLVEVKFDITDGGANETEIVSPYLILMGMDQNDYNELQVTTENATSEDPIFLKILRLGE